jgi:hypothetical protein
MKERRYVIMCISMVSSKKSTVSDRMGKMETIIESMLNSQVESLDRSAKNSQAVVALHESVNKLTALFTDAQQNTPVEEVATVKAQQLIPKVEKQADFYNYQTSAKSASVVEAVQEQKIGKTAWCREKWSYCISPTYQERWHDWQIIYLEYATN